MTARTTEGSVSELIDAIKETRQCTIELVADLRDKQLMGPRLAIVNPLRWEIGHVGWFQESWCLRYFCGEASLFSQGDSLYDSARAAHDTRWDLPLLSRSDTRLSAASSRTRRRIEW